MRMLEAIEEYAAYREVGRTRRKTIDDHRKNLMYFSLALGNPDIEQIRHKDVVNYLKQMENHGWKASSRAAVASTFRRFFKFLRGLEYHVVNPDLVPFPEVDTGVPEAVTQDEYKAILDDLQNRKGLVDLRDLILIRFLWETGARKGELLSIHMRDIQWNDSPPCVLIKTEKAKEYTRRYLVWSETTHRYVQMLYDRVGEVPLFPSLNRHYYLEPMSPQTPAAILNKLTKRVGLERKIHPHMFRHAYAIRNVQKDKSMYAISTALGHSDVRSSYRYGRLYGNEQKRLQLEMLDEK